jgi:hypothetical protein
VTVVAVTECTTALGATWRSPALLVPGDVVLIEDRQRSSEGFVHVVAEVKQSRGFVRVWFDVWRDGQRYRSAAYPRDDYRWDRLYEVRSRRRVGHTRVCSCAVCLELLMDGPMVEVMT